MNAQEWERVLNDGLVVEQDPRRSIQGIARVLADQEALIEKLKRDKSDVDVSVQTVIRFVERNMPSPTRAYAPSWIVRAVHSHLQSIRGLNP